MLRKSVALCLALSLCSLLPGQEKAKPKAKQPPARPTPTVADYAYAKDHERQRFDFWQAKSDKPTPVVLLIHGGGWMNGDKTSYGGTTIQPYLDQGISVAAINYRFILQAMEQKVEPPVKAPLHDAARALQTIRSKAKEWNIDPKRIGATGGSAGACTSLWLALHDDIADPKSDDPILRESSKLQAAAVSGAQTSLDPKELREWMPNAIYGGHAFGFAAKDRKRPEEFDLLMANREKVLPWIKEYSPIEHVTKDDPPFLILHGDADPLVPLGQSEILLEALKKAGVAAELVVIKGGGHGGKGFATPENQEKIAKFFAKHLKK